MKKTLFEINYYQYSLPDWVVTKAKILEIVRQFKEVGNYYNDTCITNYSHKIESIELCELFKPALIEFASSFNKDFEIKNIWFQEYTSGQYHSPHFHGSYGYSVIVYVQFDKTIHKPTIFCNPNTYDTENFYKSLVVNEGDLVIFPSNIVHFVEPVLTDINRTIVSCNVNLLTPNDKEYN